MPHLGAHLSIAGGFSKAIEAAVALGTDTVQIFTHSPSQWAVKRAAGAKARDGWRAAALDEQQVAAFRAAAAQHGMRGLTAHDSYLINLASPNPELWEKSLAAFIEELRRAEQLGLSYVVAHPGSHTTASEAEGLANIVRGLDAAHAATPGMRVQCLLENTAGQGTNLGWRFEHLAQLLGEVRDSERLGVCLDTCHTFAAGYPLGTPEEYEQTMAEFDRLVGLERVRAFHLNDSQGGLGSRLDRHAHIGQGQMGLEPFRLLLNDPRFSELPMFLETAHETIDGRDMNAVNLETLRGLCA